MDMSKHTNAPWYYVPQNNSNSEVNIGETVCSLTNQDRNTDKLVMSREEMEANAKLISAAPDMFKALCRCAEVFVSMQWDEPDYSISVTAALNTAINGNIQRN